ncbi:MAG TPA: flagellar assembly protein FliW [Bryobacteraceae bacterium]|jgi:flagellar assembly factor FliW
MPSVETSYFGLISYEPDSILEFPKGLPGFDERRRFVALQFEDSRPLVFLQSLEEPGLCFITLPVLAVDPHYQLRVSDEDRELVGLPLGRPLRIGEDVICLAVVSIREDGPTANLLGPLVVNLRNRKAAQAVAPESGYSHQHRLVPEEAPVCS